MTLKAYFAVLRQDPAHHLGLGDIRLTRAQQERLVALYDRRKVRDRPGRGRVRVVSR